MSYIDIHINNNYRNNKQLLLHFHLKYQPKNGYTLV